MLDRCTRWHAAKVVENKEEETSETRESEANDMNILADFLEDSLEEFRNLLDAKIQDAGAAR